MHLLYYLYMDAGLTPSLTIKVMKLKAFLLLPKLEIRSLYPTDSLSNIETLNLLGTDIITTGTGTTGDTTILTSGINTIAGTYMDNGITITTAIILFISLVVSLVLDRKSNLNQDLDQDQTSQENQENQDH